MLKFVRTIRTDAAAQMVERWLSECFSNAEGVCYYKHPAVITATGVIPDFILFTKTNQPLVIKIMDCSLPDITHLDEDTWTVNGKTVDSPILELEDLLLKLESKFLEQRKLRNRLKAQAILAFPFIGKSDFDIAFGGVTNTIDTLWAGGDTKSLLFPLDDELSNEEWTLTRSVIQGATHLHKSSQTFSQGISTLGDAIKELDKQIAALDDEQEQVVLGIAPGPQRIRGLAGTGKTVLLAMKAANIHILYPDKKILFTFNTQSLYNQAKELISKAYRDHTGTSPNWDLLHVRHGWGGRNRSGVYSDLCARQGIVPLDLRMARAIDRRKDPFQVCCEHALQRSISSEYDFILVDEAQDFPKEFFRILYKLATGSVEPRIYWAYDELQSLSLLEIPKPEDLFGYDESNKPLISLTGEDYPGPIEKDFVLHRSYRCPQAVLMLAHAIGLGIYNPSGPVQMLENQSYWEAVGYTIESGKLQKGEHVVISRPAENSPNRISELYKGRPLVTVEVFPDRTIEIEAIAQSIMKDIKVENVSPRQIMVISLDTSHAKEHLTLLQKHLVDHSIASTIPGLIDDTSAFAEAGKVTLSTVFRAKGNEAHVVYILSFDSLYDYLEGIGNRNRAFASITRSKAVVRITGVGKKMVAAKNEVNRILDDIPKFRFVFPDMKAVRRLDAENTYRRKQFEQAGNALDLLKKTDHEALEKLAALNPEALKELQKRLDEVLRENQ
jgi:superfamily I DNA and RNA helicase